MMWRDNLSRWNWRQRATGGDKRLFDCGVFWGRYFRSNEVNKLELTLLIVFNKTKHMPRRRVNHDVMGQMISAERAMEGHRAAGEALLVIVTVVAKIRGISPKCKFIRAPPLACFEQNRAYTASPMMSRWGVTHYNGRRTAIGGGRGHERHHPLLCSLENRESDIFWKHSAGFKTGNLIVVSGSTWKGSARN
jgi:hypothetical protein